jgi:hypothetical protein
MSDLRGSATDHDIPGRIYQSKFAVVIGGADAAIAPDCFETLSFRRATSAMFERVFGFMVGSVQRTLTSK